MLHSFTSLSACTLGMFISGEPTQVSESQIACFGLLRMFFEIGTRHYYVSKYWRQVRAHGSTGSVCLLFAAVFVLYSFIYATVEVGVCPVPWTEEGLHSTERFALIHRLQYSAILSRRERALMMLEHG